MVLRSVRFLVFSVLLIVELASAETLEEVLNKAFKQNLDYQIALEQLQTAYNNERTAFGQLFPDLNLTANRNEQLSNNQQLLNSSDYSARLELSQVLYDPAVWHAWKVSELRTLTAELAYLRQKQILVFNVKQTWFQLITDQALSKEAQASLERLKQHRNNAQHLYANGKIWRNDLLQADVRVARGEQARLIAENTVKRTLTNLNVLLNQNILVDIKPQEQAYELNSTAQLGQSLTTALANRPDLKQLQVAVQIARNEKQSARSGYFPKLTARLTQNHLSEQFDFADSSRNTQLSINMNWTLWDNFSIRNQNRNALHAIEIAQKSYQQTRELVQQETHNAWLALQEAKQNIAVLEQAVDQAEENFRVTEIRYKEQLSTANDVLDAQDLLTSTRNDLLAARGDFFTALAQLDFAMGVAK
ncbi:TolC family protein [Planctobacterium marinum]|uniref:Protein CyaE n=1 Tax=Planctobacterium marinum TaxID=1631968 RepID=A0AA48KRM5_9ALTE|nr:protein CyaE [Planctobacterium marinum]